MRSASIAVLNSNYAKKVKSKYLCLANTHFILYNNRRISKIREKEDDIMKKTIIVTGGAGFIGSNFIFHLMDKYPDYRVICLDKLTYAGNLSTLKSVINDPRFRFVKADICDREAVYRLFEEEKPDILVNFAAESHVDRSIEDPSIQI